MKKAKTYITRQNQIYHASRVNRDYEWRNTKRVLFLGLAVVVIAPIIIALVLFLLDFLKNI